MKAWNAAMQTRDEGDVRAAVVQELATYWNRDQDYILDRCIRGEEYVAQEWNEHSSEDPSEIVQDIGSWTFLLLWYDYLRGCGYALPLQVAAASWLSEHASPGSVLDYGSGTGTASMMFHGLGWRATMGDVSMPLLDFARWRSRQRGLQIDSIDLRQSLPASSYDVVLAIDTFAHIEDVRSSVAALHAATRPGGYLLVNFNLREPSEDNGMYLNSQLFDLYWNVRRGGFRKVGAVADGMLEIYQRVDRNTASFRGQLVVDAVHYGPPSHPYWRLKRAALRLARRAARRLLAPQ
jgi:2-polyprenyl-3-methyl-5-hydroxy-6-metoxy-1,4-benzoquinol methylase